MRLKKWVVLACLVGTVACGVEDPGSGDQITVVASFYPLAFVAGEVGGDLIEVDNLTPAGAEPHGVELTASQVRALASADLVLYLGSGFQPSVEQAVGTIEGQAVDALATQPGATGDSGFDPHVWLDPQRTAAIVRLVRDRFAAVDPDHAATYERNADRLEARLDALDRAYRDGLAGCERDAIVTSHEAFGHLAAAYGLHHIGISGIDPEAEPSPQGLTEAVEFVNERRLTTVFFEVLMPPVVAETLADETGARIARLNPIENPPRSGDYFTAMRANLDEIREGLGCE
jgi:zinc transport system substrate-binding protein